MKKINLYQDSKECLFWTRSEFEELEKKYPKKFELDNEQPFVYEHGGYEFRQYIRNTFSTIDNGLDPKIELGDINIFVLTGTFPLYKVMNLLNEFEKNPEKKFILIDKHPEDYWLCIEAMNSNELYERIAGMNNVIVFWDNLAKFNNFHFLPKMMMHSYHNVHQFNGFFFFNGYEIFKHHPKDKRIGIHINKHMIDKIRYYLYTNFKHNTHDKLFFTNRKEYKHSVFELNFIDSNNAGTEREWFNLQFLDQTLKSDIEVVYETFSIQARRDTSLKWNEKSIKHLFLGKPFIHSDPTAHSLFKVYGLEPYRSLYMDELWEIYSNWDMRDFLVLKDGWDSYLPLLQRNIEWLLDMEDSEWQERLELANTLAIKNKEVVNDLVYNHSLLPYLDIY